MVPKFIIYGLVDPRTDEVRYIGKSSRGLKRARAHAFPSVLNGCNNHHKARWIAGLKDAGLMFGVLVLGEFASATELDNAERWAIAFAREAGWPLTNILPGGEGGATFAGRRHSPETLARMSAVKRGKKKSPEARERMRLAAVERSRRPTEIARIKSLNVGRRHARTAEFCAKISAALKGKPKPYMAQRNRSREWTDEMRRKISDARRGKATHVRQTVTLNGQTHSIAEWARRVGVPYGRLRDRIVKLNWSPERAMIP